MASTDYSERIAVGIDIGGTNTKFGLVNHRGEILAKGSIKTDSYPVVEDFIEELYQNLEPMIKQHGNMTVLQGIGIGAPNANYYKGTIEEAPNLNWKGVVPFAELVTKKFGKPCTMTNDANAAALGEMMYGAARGMRDFIMITLGTGVGSGIIVNGKLVTGVNYAAGEMGHTVIVYNGLQCNCGRKGCWEKYSSATALIEQTKDAMRKNFNSLMWDIAGGDLNKVNGRTAFDGMRKGDATAQAVVNNYVAMLSCGIGNIINTFQPSMVCVGGGVGNEKENLLGPVRKLLSSEIYTIHAKKQTQLVAAELGNDAGIIGAALLDE